MQTLTEAIIAAGWRERILCEAPLERLLGGSAQRRYSLVNRAQYSGELVRLRRSRYRLAAPIAGSWPHPFVAAQDVAPFLAPPEQASLKLWGERFFAGKVAKLVLGL